MYLKLRIMLVLPVQLITGDSTLLLVIAHQPKKPQEKASDSKYAAPISPENVDPRCSERFVPQPLPHAFTALPFSSELTYQVLANPSLIPVALMVHPPYDVASVPVLHPVPNVSVQKGV